MFVEHQKDQRANQRVHHLGHVHAAELAAVDTAHGLFRCRPAQAVAAGQPVMVTARPEDLVLSGSAPDSGLNTLTGTVSGRVFLGEVIDYMVDIGEAELRIRARPEHEFRVRQAVHIGVAPDKCIALPS